MSPIEIRLVLLVLLLFNIDTSKAGDDSIIPLQKNADACYLSRDRPFEKKLSPSISDFQDPSVPSIESIIRQGLKSKRKTLLTLEEAQV